MAKHAATGQYILFIDSDDYVDLEFMSKLTSQKSDLTICGIGTYDEKGVLLSSTHYVSAYFKDKNTIDFPELYKNCVLYSVYCKLFRNDIIREHKLRFSVNITWGEDGMFVADYLQYVNSLAVTNYLGYFYYKHGVNTTLSTTVKENSIDMVVKSREYCIDKMLETSPQNYEAVKIICAEDIRRNCAYFVSELLDSSMIDKRTKSKMLDGFRRHKYVTDTFKNSQKYYGSNMKIRPTVSEAKSASIIKAHRIMRGKQEFYTRLYFFYDCQPQIVKRAYRKLKMKVQR